MSWTRETESYQSTREDRIRLKDSISRVGHWIQLLDSTKIPSDLREHAGIICGALADRLKHEAKQIGDDGGES